MSVNTASRRRETLARLCRILCPHQSLSLILKAVLACCLISLAAGSILSMAQSHTSTSQDTNEIAPPQTSGLHQWGAVTLFHGLPSDQVRVIAQDSDGAMWFGTDAGLARYDGRRTQAITAEGLPDGRVLALKVDMQGALWVGTESGAAKFFNGIFHAIKETAGFGVTAIITPERGRAVLATEQGVIFDCRANADGSFIVRSIPDQPLLSADADHAGKLHLTSLGLLGNTLYVGTLSRGLLAAQQDDNTVKEILSRPRPFFIEAVETDSQGHLWLGAKTSAVGGGLYDASEPQRPSQISISTGTVTALHAGAGSNLWVGTDGRGAFHYQASSVIEHFTFENTAGGLRSNHIYAIFVDREGVVWFGTDKGVCRYDPHALRTQTISDDPESNFVRTLFQTSSGQLLCGTNRGLFIYDKASSRWSAVKALARNTIYALAEDNMGRLLIGSANGLYSAAASREINADSTFARIRDDAFEKGAIDSVRTITQFAGAIYIASFGRGVERVDGERRTLVCPVDPADARCRDAVSLHDDKSGKLWIGTASRGIFLFDGRGILVDPHLDKLIGSAVWSIDENPAGRFWFATAQGLYNYQTGGDLSSVIAGVDARSVVAVAAKGNDQSSASKEVWCATAGGGLLKLLMDERFGAIISRLDVEQGLPSQNVFAILPLRAGEASDEPLLIGTSRGVARYEPGSILPKLLLTRIISKRIHQLTELQQGLSLEYPQNSLVLELAATSSRTFPEQFQYALLLFDGAGRGIKQKFAHDGQFTMEGLRPGKYRVEVLAYTKDLVASEPLRFEFSVMGAPFPRTTAALSVLLALTLIVLMWGYLQNRKITLTSTALAAANHQLADARLQLANEAEAERRRIARDLHDQTLADLRHLMLLTDQLPVNETNDNQFALAPPIFRQEIEAVSNEIRRICEDLSPSVLENVGLMAALEWALTNAVAHSPVGCKFEYEFACDESIEERLQFAPGVRMQLYRITQEAINNICRHAGATRVKLTAELSHDGEFILKIEDDGKDFDPKVRKRKSGRGLANISARASLIEAEVRWNRRTEGGTTFILRKAGAAPLERLG